MELNGKAVQVVMACGFNAKYGGLESILYMKEAFAVLQKHPMDMLVFEMADEHTMQIRAGGYDLATDSILDEKTIFFQTESLHVDKFYFKLDDYGDRYVGTFLLANEY